MLWLILSIALAVVALLVPRALRESRIDREHGFTIDWKGRGGTIWYRRDGRVAEMPWERLVSEPKMAVYSSNLRWRRPTAGPVQEHDASEILARFDAYMAAKGLTYELA